jgi:hypothetical protein
MNIKALQWLLKHREMLLKVVEIAKTFRKDSTYLEQWAVADAIAKIVLPVLEAEAVAPRLFSFDIDEDYGVSAMTAGAEVGALGIDWKLMVEVILPIVISILELFVKRQDD